MFVIRIVMASCATIAGAMVVGIAFGKSLWLSAGLAVLAVVFLQFLAVGYVVCRTLRKPPAAPCLRVQRGLSKTGDQLFILPR